MNIEIVKGNPLYFPSGNENGHHYETLWIAEKDGRCYHGNTPDIALSNALKNTGEKQWLK